MTAAPAHPRGGQSGAIKLRHSMTEDDMTNDEYPGPGVILAEQIEAEIDADECTCPCAYCDRQGVHTVAAVHGDDYEIRDH